MMSQPKKAVIAINILSNISKGEGSQTVKFDQLIEHNMKNIFLKKSFPKCIEETILRSFSKNSKLSISLDH